jgi:hypothetical protein
VGLKWFKDGAILKSMSVVGHINRLKDKTHDYSINAERHLIKISIPS